MRGTQASWQLTCEDSAEPSGPSFAPNPSANGQYTVETLARPIQIEERLARLTRIPELSGPEVFEGREQPRTSSGFDAQLDWYVVRVQPSPAHFPPAGTSAAHRMATSWRALATRQPGGCPAELGLQALDGVDLPVGCPTRMTEGRFDSFNNLSSSGLRYGVSGL